MGDTSCPLKTAHDAVLYTETEDTVDSCFTGYLGLNSTQIVDVVVKDSTLFKIVWEVMKGTDVLRSVKVSLIIFWLM